MVFSGYAITGVALAGCVYLVCAHHAHSRLGLVGAFSAIWLACALIRSTWFALVYPHYLSPLRKVPTVGGGHWLLGHSKKFLSPHSEPTREWYVSIHPLFLFRVGSRLGPCSLCRTATLIYATAVLNTDASCVTGSRPLPTMD